MPLTLVNAHDDTDVAVVEMGARGAGHIAWLCAIARPTIAVVTAVELVHAEMMGDLDAIARAKGELVEALPADGVAVLNGANPRVAAMAERTSARVDPLRRRPRRRAGHRAWCSTPTSGPGSVMRVAVGLDRRAPRGAGPAPRSATPWRRPPSPSLCDVPIDEVAAGLEASELSPWRMDLRTAPSGARVLNDAYNAGPASMEAALRAVAHLDAARHHAVLGPMAELGAEGPAAAPAHRGPWPTSSGCGWWRWAPPDYGVGAVPDADAAARRAGRARSRRRRAGEGQPGGRPGGGGRAAAQPLTGLDRVGGRRGMRRRRVAAGAEAAALLGRAQVAVPGQQHGHDGPGHHHGGDRGEVDEPAGHQAADGHGAAEAHDPHRAGPAPDASRRGGPGTRWPAT